VNILIKIDEPARPGARPGFALWQLGFRPFYLLASAFAAVSVALWALQFSDLLAGAYLHEPLWHAHEMIFGFALAVIVGFLFTAGRNWTNLPTPTGRPLMMLAALWLAARLAMLTPWPWFAAVTNVAFPLAAAIALAIPFVRARSGRNYFFVALLLLLAAAAAAIHADRLGIAPLPPWAGVQLALDVVLFIVVVMAGRVIPMFTNNGVPGAQARRLPWLEKLALGSVLALIIASLVRSPWGIAAAIAATAAVAHGLRWWMWQPWKSLAQPLVWVLHLAYLWIPAHLAMRALAAAGAMASSHAAHALTTGAIGGLVIGMMVRTARGHTARPLRASRCDVACFILVGAAAVVRVLLPMALPQAYMPALLGSAFLWSAGFGLYAGAYWPSLSRARLDGRAG
jgi:uncharacterized protein involved in response to NO